MFLIPRFHSPKLLQETSESTYHSGVSSSSALKHFHTAPCLHRVANHFPFMLEKNSLFQNQLSRKHSIHLLSHCCCILSLFGTQVQHNSCE